MQNTPHTDRLESGWQEANRPTSRCPCCHTYAIDIRQTRIEVTRAAAAIAKTFGVNRGEAIAEAILRAIKES